MSSPLRSDFHLFIQENGAWLLTFFGIIGGGLSAMTVYFLKSRCSHIKLCCGAVDCVREPIPLEAIDVEARPVA